MSSFNTACSCCCTIQISVQNLVPMKIIVFISKNVQNMVPNKVHDIQGTGDFTPSSYLKLCGGGGIMFMIFCFMKLHFSNCNRSWVVSIGQNMNFNLKPAITFILCFSQKCLKFFVFWRSISIQDLTVPLWHSCTTSIHTAITIWEQIRF